jgi:integrase/recombinase XerD
MKKEFPNFKSSDKGNSKDIERKLSPKDREIINEFCLYCSINSQSPKRADSTKRMILQLSSFIEKPLNKINNNDFLIIVDAINKGNRSINGKNDLLHIIKKFGKWLEEKNNTSFSNLKAIKMKKYSSKLTHNDLITELEFDKLMKSTSNLMHKTLICFLWESAGRPEEILKTKWNDLDFSKGVVKLHSSKTGQIRIIPLDITFSHLKRLKEEGNHKENDLIFKSQKQNNQLSNSSFNFIIKSLSKKAEINKEISGYTFRHTRLSYLIRKLSPKIYEMFAGHSLSMGMRTYAHLSPDELREEMKEKVFEIKELNPDEKKEFEEMKKDLSELKNQTALVLRRVLNGDSKIKESLKYFEIEDNFDLNKKAKPITKEEFSKIE